MTLAHTPQSEYEVAPAFFQGVEAMARLIASLEGRKRSGEILDYDLPILEGCYWKLYLYVPLELSLDSASRIALIESVEALEEPGMQFFVVLRGKHARGLLKV